MTGPFVAQTSIADSLTRGFPGMLADAGPHDCLHGFLASDKIVSVAITAANSTHYIVTVTQRGTAVAYDYTSDGSATTAEITAGLVALSNAGTQSIKASGSDTPLVIAATGKGDLADFSATYNGNMVETVTQAPNQPVTYGKFVCQDDVASPASGDNEFRLPRAAADITGARARGPIVGKNFTSVAGGFVRGNSMASCLRKGRVYVQVEEAVVDGSPVYVRYAAGGNGAGSFRTSAGSSEAAQLPNAVYRAAAGINGVSIVDLNLPG